MAYLSIKRISIAESFFGNGFELLTEEAQENKVRTSIEKTIKDAQSKPKSWVANKILSFRKLYATYLDKLNREKDQKKIGFIQNIIRLILTAIDKLASLLQDVTDIDIKNNKSKTSKVRSSSKKFRNNINNNILFQQQQQQFIDDQIRDVQLHQQMFDQHNQINQQMFDQHNQIHQNFMMNNGMM